jgi:repressor LexA
MSEHEWTEKQGQYLAFIYNYTVIHGEPPAEADMQRFFRVSPPTVHQMVLRLDEKGLISREPGEPRTIQVLVPPDKLPYLKARRKKSG